MTSVYTARDMNGIAQFVSVIEANVDNAITLDSTLTKREDTTLAEWVVPKKAEFKNGEWVRIIPSLAPQVQAALWRFLKCCDEWDVGLLIQKAAVKTFGHAALLAARQAAIDYAQDTTYSAATREIGLNNLCLGSADGINSPERLAAAIDSFDSTDPTTLTKFILWIDRATGARITLPQAFDPANQWGMLNNADFNIYARPAVTA